MNFKPYKSPFGFHFTAEEEERYQQALESAARFFETYGKGRKPVTSFGIVQDVDQYSYRLVYGRPGSLDVMRKKAETEEPQGDWMTLDQLAVRLGIGRKTLYQKIIRLHIPCKQIKIRSYKVNLYQLSEVTDGLAEQPKHKLYQRAPRLTEEEVLSGRWMRPTDIARELGLGEIRFSLFNKLNYHKIPFKVYTDKHSPTKYYNIDLVRELPFVQALIKKHSK